MTTVTISSGQTVSSASITRGNTEIVLAGGASVDPHIRGGQLQVNGGTASSDIGEVSAAVPLAELNVATRPLGTSAHHWAQTACAAHPVGYKGMAVAAKIGRASCRERV